MEPRTQAGRDAAARLRDCNVTRDDILAIEAEAAALDVEVLAEALADFYMPLGYDVLPEDAPAIAAEYARLRESASGGKPTGAERGTA